MHVLPPRVTGVPLGFHFTIALALAFIFVVWIFDVFKHPDVDLYLQEGPWCSHGEHTLISIALPPDLCVPLWVSNTRCGL